MTLSSFCRSVNCLLLCLNCYFFIPPVCPLNTSGIDNFYSMSYLYFGAMATSSVVLVGLIVSYATGKTNLRWNKKICFKYYLWPSLCFFTTQDQQRGVILKMVCYGGTWTILKKWRSQQNATWACCRLSFRLNTFINLQLTMEMGLNITRGSALASSFSEVWNPIQDGLRD